MGRDKPNKSSQQHQMDKFTVSSQKGRTQDHGTASDQQEGDKFAEIFPAIQASKVALEGQIWGAGCSRRSPWSVRT